MAESAFAKQTCPGFLFDVEFFLTAVRHHYRQTELPVTLYLNSEKSTVKLFREFFLAVFWLMRIRWRDHQGMYGSAV